MQKFLPVSSKNLCWFLFVQLAPQTNARAMLFWIPSIFFQQHPSRSKINEHDLKQNTQKIYSVSPEPYIACQKYYGFCSSSKYFSFSLRCLHFHLSLSFSTHTHTHTHTHTSRSYPIASPGLFVLELHFSLPLKHALWTLSNYTLLLRLVPTDLILLLRGQFPQQEQNLKWL